MKEPKDMLLDGWCEGCDMDPATCIANGICKAYEEEEVSNDEETI